MGSENSTKADQSQGSFTPPSSMGVTPQHTESIADDTFEMFQVDPDTLLNIP